MKEALYFILQHCKGRKEGSGAEIGGGEKGAAPDPAALKRRGEGEMA